MRAQVPCLSPYLGLLSHLSTKKLCKASSESLGGWSWQGGAQGSQGPLTWMGFSMSPSHRDTNGTVNGFHTGSSVYLITCSTGRAKREHRPRAAVLWAWASPMVGVAREGGPQPRSWGWQ